MLRTILTTAAIIAGMGLAVPTNAYAGPGDKRQQIQRDRIQQGIRHGEVTRREARRLGHEQRRIERMQRRAWRDGELTCREGARLHRRQDRASRHIYRAKHNRRSRD